MLNSNWTKWSTMQGVPVIVKVIIKIGQTETVMPIWNQSTNTPVSRGYPITGIQLRNVQIGYLKLDTHMIVCHVTNRHMENKSGLRFLFRYNYYYTSNNNYYTCNPSVTYRQCLRDHTCRLWCVSGYLGKDPLPKQRVIIHWCHFYSHMSNIP